MEKRNIRYTILILLTSLISILSLTLLTFKTKKEVKHEMYDKMVMASELSLSCFNEIKRLKLENGPLPSYDIFESGMLGLNKKTSITTTEGMLEAKRTTCNPSFAAMLIKVFYDNGLKENDEVGLMFSSSFPAMNISVLATCEVYNLKIITMAGIGASYYGANDPNFTFFDMSEHLYNNGYLKNKIDYVSLGGDEDIGRDFKNVDEKNNIIERISSSNTTFIYEEDFKTNIEKRMDIFSNDLPNIKMFINVGGTMVGFGKGLTSFSSSGFFKSASDANVKVMKNDNYGLLQRMIIKGIPIFNIINIKDLSNKYNLEYDPVKMPIIGSEGVYYTYKYNNILLYLIFLLFIATIFLLFVINKKFKYVEERNYIVKKGFAKKLKI